MEPMRHKAAEKGGSQKLKSQIATESKRPG
jgi:hypothetical protein